MISFLIVNWNGGDVFKKCIHSIEKNTLQAGIGDYEIVVVDNHSSDLDPDWLQRKKNVRLKKNKKNLQFAVGTNQCVEHSTGEILFFLNNDVILRDNCLKSLLHGLQSKPVDAVVPRLFYPNGGTQYSVRGFPSISNVLAASVGLHFLVERMDTWLLKNFDYTRKQQVDQPMFSALVTHRRTWEQVGVMDERFPLLFNDVDWFFRFRQKGLKCLFLPDAEAMHVHGMSVNRNMFRKVLISVKSMILYFKKHRKFSFQGMILLYAVSIITVIVRMVREGFLYIQPDKNKINTSKQASR